MNSRKKYIFENGVMKLNPNYVADHKDEKTTVADPSKSLAIISSTQDIAVATEAQEKATGQPMQLALSTQSSMEIVQDFEET